MKSLLGHVSTLSLLLISSGFIYSSPGKSEEASIAKLNHCNLLEKQLSTSEIQNALAASRSVTEALPLQITFRLPKQNFLLASEEANSAVNELYQFESRVASRYFFKDNHACSGGTNYSQKN